MSDTSVFDLLQPPQTPQEKELREWIGDIFTQTADQSAFQLAIQLGKLFEAAVFSNQIEDTHILLQHGVPPDLRWDWGLTPLMCANYLHYDELSKLLISYGANSQAQSFSGIKAIEFEDLPVDSSAPECAAILTRCREINEQIEKGYLKPLSAHSKTVRTITHPTKKNRQIDNGKGVDEVFKKISDTTE